MESIDLFYRTTLISPEKNNIQITYAQLVELTL